MAGLLGDVLPWVYSRGDALKRQLGGLLTDPAGVAQQAAGLLTDRDREQQGLMAQAFSNPQRPFKVTDSEAMGRAASNMLTGPLGLAPMGTANPLLVYHGTKTPGFERFNTRGETSALGDDFKFSPLGAWFTDSQRIAKNYATDFRGTGADGAVISANLSLKNPFEVSYDKLNELVRNQRAAKAFRAELEARGHDGMKVGRYGGQDGYDYVAFFPEQIRQILDK